MTFCFPGCLHRNVLKESQMENDLSGPWLPLQTGLGHLKDQLKLSGFAKFHLFSGFLWLPPQPLTQPSCI